MKVADVLLDLGYALTAQDEWGEAEKLAQEALAIYQARKGSFFTGEYWALQSLSRILIKRGDYAAAEPVARQMVEWQLRNNAKDPAAAAKAIDNLVDVLKAAGKTEEAEVERSRAAAIRQSSAKPPPSPASEVWNEGQQAARKGDWVKAAAAMTDAVAADSKLLGKSYTNVMRLASVLVESGDLDGYRKLCASLTEAAANAKDRNTAVSLARTGLLLPNTELPLEECSRLTAIALQSGSGEFNWPWTLAINALNEYRCERFENAASAAAQSLADPRCHVACRPLAAPVLAMAQFRAGRIDVARIALQAAEEEHRKGWFDDTRKDLGTFWYDWLVGHILLREARGLIEGTASPASQAQ